MSGEQVIAFVAQPSPRPSSSPEIEPGISTSLLLTFIIGPLFVAGVYVYLRRKRSEG